MSSAYNHVPRAKVAATRLLVAFLTVIDLIHRCAGPLSGFFAREGRLVLYAVFFHHQLYNEDVGILLLPTTFHSWYRFRIANPAQREHQGATEHPPRRIVTCGPSSVTVRFLSHRCQKLVC